MLPDMAKQVGWFVSKRFVHFFAYGDIHDSAVVSLSGLSAKLTTLTFEMRLRNIRVVSRRIVGSP